MKLRDNIYLFINVFSQLLMFYLFVYLFINLFINLFDMTDSSRLK